MSLAASVSVPVEGTVIEGSVDKGNRSPNTKIVRIRSFEVAIRDFEIIFLNLRSYVTTIFRAHLCISIRIMAPNPHCTVSYSIICRCIFLVVDDVCVFLFITGLGVVVTALVQQGRLRVGQTVVAGTAHGKVRLLLNDRGQSVQEVGPSTPVRVR